MSVARNCVVAVLTAAVTLGSTRAAQAQGSLSAARDLYAAAAYDEALTALNALSSNSDTISDSSTVALYKALCLYALNRNAEGDRAVEAMVAQHPMYRPPLDELSPRMRTTMIDTRKRMLPAIVQQEYADAKSAYERQDYAAALAGFTQVIEGASDPDLAAAAQSPLRDLVTLATGFRDLADKALMPPPTPKVAVTLLPAPVVAPSAPRIYSVVDTDVAAPVAIRQEIPIYTRPILQRKTAVVELLVNESGAVESATMLSALDPAYDRAVVAAARTWQYQPAKMDGNPVRYKKRVQIALVPTVGR